MEVETYEVKELTVGAIEETDTEAISIIKNLNLEGQQKLIAGTDKDVTLIPYREMTLEESFIYTFLLVTHESVNNYSAGQIPIRVLQVLAHAQQLEHYERFEVWHASGQPDPILVGITRGYSDPNHILARWGDVLMSLDELLPKAFAMFKADRLKRLLKIKQEVEGDIKIMEDASNESASAYFEHTNIPGYYNR